jgi:hypothetical protein
MLARESYAFGMKFDGDSFHFFGGMSLPCEGTFCTVFRVVPRDLSAEIREVPINSRSAMPEAPHHPLH